MEQSWLGTQSFNGSPFWGFVLTMEKQMKEKLIERIKEISQALEHSAASHNALLGRLQEAQKLLADCESVVQDVVEIIHPE